MISLAESRFRNGHEVDPAEEWGRIRVGLTLEASWRFVFWFGNLAGLFLHDFWRAFSIKIQAVKFGEMDRWRVSFVFSWG